MLHSVWQNTGNPILLEKVTVTAWCPYLSSLYPSFAKLSNRCGTHFDLMMNGASKVVSVPLYPPFL